MKTPIILTLAFLNFGAAYAQAMADKVIGTYLTNTKEGKIKIFKENNSYYSKILWRKDARKDSENPDEALRNNSVIGLVFLKDFVFNGKNLWSGGEVYSFDNGNTYSGKMWLEDEGQTLKMRGFLGISLLGRTATFTRSDE
ncbi:DUF2147 domain-containing protein [Maribacter sp.]|nr:DUF2147 domain-containing protein [Maribacter sp.]